VPDKVAALAMIAEIVAIDLNAAHVSRIRIKASVSKAKEIVNRIQTKDLVNNKAKATGMHAVDVTAVVVVDVMVAMKALKAKTVLNHVMMPATNQLVQSQSK
jgi:hypothetical protein